MAQGLAADTEDTSEESQGEQETLQPGPSSSQFPQLSELRETYNTLMANAEPPHDDDNEEDEISMFIRSGGQIMMQDETTCEEQPSIKGSTAKPAAKTKTKTTIPQAEPEASQAKKRSTKQVQLKPKSAPRSKASQAHDHALDVKDEVPTAPKRMPRTLPQPPKKALLATRCGAGRCSAAGPSFFMPFSPVCGADTALRYWQGVHYIISHSYN